MAHADDVQAVSVDEALIEATSSVALLRAKNPDGEDPAKDFAEFIRNKVREATGCEGNSNWVFILNLFEFDSF